MIRADFGLANENYPLGSCEILRTYFGDLRDFPEMLSFGSRFARLLLN